MAFIVLRDRKRGHWEAPVGNIWQLNHIPQEPAGHPQRVDGHEGCHEWKVATQAGQQSPFKDKEWFPPYFSKKEETFLRSPPAKCPSQLTGQTWLTLPSSDLDDKEKGISFPGLQLLSSTL